jgi:hypothetical protein
MQPRTAQTAKSAADPHSPIHHTRKMSAQFSQLIEHLRRDIVEVDEPQFRAICETAAEVMGGLVTTFRHYEQKREAAWNRQARNS